MKRLLLLLILTLATAGGIKAMSYEQARREAWFLTDKMAYELNLTPTQFDCAYRVNLDYLMSINTASDCYGYYWSYRDDDLRCILFDWQYALYSSLDYFYRPVRWLRYHGISLSATTIGGATTISNVQPSTSVTAAACGHAGGIMTSALIADIVSALDAA